MTRRPRGRADPFESNIETALAPGRYVPYIANYDFVRRLEFVEQQLQRLVPTESARAIVLYETFLAGCYEKAEEIDDSSASLGQFVEDLFRGWIITRQAAGADPDETATRLLAWMDDDPYGFASDLDKEAAKVLDKAGLAAFERQILARFDTAATMTAAGDGSFRSRPDYVRRRWGEALRTLYLARNNVQAYVALAEETGLTAQDCHAIATLLVTRRKPEEALTWVERGIDLDKKTAHGSMAGHDLAKLKRELLTKLGRSNEAGDAAWAEYREQPSKYTYDDLMKFVPKAERSKWHEKAIEAAKGADLHCLMDLLLQTKELDRLAELVRGTEDQALEGLSHYATEPVAKMLDKTHPDLAARLWRAQGMRIVNARKSKSYDAARSNFESAKRCFERAGLTTEWEKTVSQVRGAHHRKTGFMSGFERLVAGSGPSNEPSFVQRAKARWNRRQRRER